MTDGVKQYVSQFLKGGDIKSGDIDFKTFNGI